MSREPAAILVVDDNPQNLGLLEGLLKSRYRVRPATSGARALRAARSSPPDLIMLDVSMPEMDGYEVCRRLKADEATRSIPVIFISAMDEAMDKVKAFGAGAADYVSKPFQFEEVLARIEHQLSLARAMRELAAKNEELERLNEEKNRVVGIVAHDLRSPLAGVVMWAELLKFRLEGHLTGENATYLETILSAARKMMHFVEELLDVAQIESGHLHVTRAPVDVSDLVRRTVELHRLLAERKEIRLELVEEDALPMLSVDAGKIGQVLDNLIANAIKYSPAGTTTVVRLRRGADEAVVSVEDQGPGIPPEESMNLFKFFGRTSARPTGGEHSTGLGLAIARRIVEVHGGRVWFESATGGGSIFSFALPTGRAHESSP